MPAPPNNRLQRTALRAAAEPERKVALNVIARLATVFLVALCISSALIVQASDDPKVTDSSRDNREAESRAAFAHVRKIHAPQRNLKPEDIGQQHLASSGKELLVIGSISDRSVGVILSQVNQHAGKRVARDMKVTGDEQYAVVEIGNRERDPCCFGTLLFANHKAAWVMVADTWMSH